MRSPALGLPAPAVSGVTETPYQALEAYLNEQWQQQRNGMEIKISCAPESKGLSVGVEHAIAVQPPVKATFARLKDLLEAAPSDIWSTHPDAQALPEVLKVQFFIRVLNQEQSYSEAEEVILRRSQGPNPDVSGHNAAATPDRSVPPASAQEGTGGDPIDDPEFAGEIALEPEVAAAFSPNHLRLEPLPEEAAIYDNPATVETADELTDAAASDPFGTGHDRQSDAGTGDPSADYEEEQEVEEWAGESIHIPRSIWAAGLGLCMMAFAGSFYIVSRPCWFRNCPSLIVAQEEVDQANNMLQVASTWDDLEQARQRLNKAIRELRSVPGWTSYGEQARGLRVRNRRLLKSLTPIQDALKQAESAQSKSGTGTLKIKQWQEVLVHWEAAIAQLKGVAPESPMYALAQDKLVQYEANLKASNSRLAEEQEAQRLLSKARTLASEAPDKTDDLETLEFLQRTQIKLQDALYTLRQVPRGTTAYKEAVRLMSRYESELALNQGQQTREEFIVNTYGDAINSAESAKIAEANDRWDDATDHWKAAIASIDQIPSASSYFAKAQGLVSEYSYALQQAEEKAEQYAALQKVRDELAGVCEGSPLVCTHDVTSQLIEVTLTLEYERAILTAGSVGDESSRISALNHVHALETSLEKISNQAQIPLELYDPDGVLVGTHEPRGSFNAI